MTAAALFAELHGAGIRLSLRGDTLRVEAKPGALSPELRERLATAKLELIARLQADLRARLLVIAQGDDFPSALVESLPDADVAACDGLSDDTLRAYLRALHRGAGMDAGIVPVGYGRAARCDGCGPVWLWPEAPPHVIACPWCFRRKAGRPFPRPAAVKEEE